eukprot:m51a1_g12715 hypothetical protein (201) ;mRNA; f:555-1302
MADVVDMDLPKDWAKVTGELQSGFTRPEMVEFARLFMLFDINHDGVIDFMELKMAQEKMGAKTHQQMRGYMEAMQKSGREPHVGFRDWVQLQGLIASRTLVWAGGRAGFIPPVEVSGATVADDQSQDGKKKFFEQLANEQKAVIDREQKLKGPSSAVAKRKEKEEKEALEKAKQEKAEEEKRKRKEFQERQRQMFEQQQQ